MENDLHWLLNDSTTVKRKLYCRMSSSMSKEQFDAMMQKGYDEAQAGIGLSVDEAFKKVHDVV